MLSTSERKSLSNNLTSTSSGWTPGEGSATQWRTPCKIKIERIEIQNLECINNFNRKFSTKKNRWLCLLWRIKLGPDLNNSFLIITEDNFSALYRESISVFIKKIINLLLSYMQVEWKYKLKLEIPEQERFTRSKSTEIFSIFHPKISLLDVHNIRKGNLKEGGKNEKSLEV